MNFKKVFRGYDPDEVDKYIAETALKEQQIRNSQKERIDELSDENHSLRQQVKQYQTDEQAISKSLVASQHLAQELKFDAERYSDLVLSRAKIFYATWRAYAKTLIASLSKEEVESFNALQKKIEDVINAYEGKDVAREIDERSAQRKAEAEVETKAAEAAKAEAETDKTAAAQVAAQPVHVQSVTEEQHASEEEKWRQARAVVDVTPSETTMRIYNPISKVEQASGQVIDLRELTKTDMSLEDLCAELGLIVKKDD